MQMLPALLCSLVLRAVVVLGRAADAEDGTKVQPSRSGCALVWLLIRSKEDFTAFRSSARARAAKLVLLDWFLSDC